MTGARVLHPDELAPGPATPGMERWEAFAAEDRWVGRATSEPGVTSGWHHHGLHDTYFYGLAGATQIDLEDGEGFEVRAGDFANIPAGTVHRESLTGEVTLDAVIVRIGFGPQVVPVDDPS